MQRRSDDTRNANSTSSGTPAHGNDSFDPGPSFVEDTATGAGDDGLPSWLQNFAEVSGHHEAPELRQTVPLTTVPPESPPARPASSRDTNSVDFFNDDDLPEWLRALSVDQPATSDDVTAEQIEEQPSETIVVPPTSRAWVASHEHARAVPGSVLFAEIAQEADQRPNADTGGGVGGSSPAPMVLAPASIAPSTRPESDTPAQSDEQSKRTRLILIAAAIIVLVLFVILVGR